MPEWAETLIMVAASLVLVWLALVVVLALQARRHGATLTARGAVRLGPDVVRLIARLVRDSSVPGSTRIVLGLLVTYLLCPIDLVPDFIPVIGYADDILIAALALRVAVRGAGYEAVRRHWPGTADGLAAVLTLTGLAGPTPTHQPTTRERLR